MRVHHQGGTTIPTSCVLHDRDNLLAIGSIDVEDWNYCTNGPLISLSQCF